MHPHRPAPSRLLACLAAITLLAAAHAQEGLELGLATFPTDGFVLAAHASLPLFETREVRHEARADLSWAFDGPPGVAATYQLSGTPEGGTIERYLGAGLGLSFPAEPVASPLLSAHGLVGARLPVSDRFHAYVEGTVAGNAIDAGLGLGVGIAYIFGGGR